AEVDRVAAATTVLPVGVDVDRFDRPRTEHRPPVVLWNHRWEYDKDPEAFFAALDRVVARGVELAVAIAGHAPPTVPEAFARARDRLGHRVVHFGTAAEDGYPALLAGADVVVSTARHEFFGLAVAEAVSAGALPLLPDRLAYPGLVPSPSPYLYRDLDELVERLCWALTDHDGRRRAAAAARDHVRRLAWPEVAPSWTRWPPPAAPAAPGARRRRRGGGAQPANTSSRPVMSRMRTSGRERRPRRNAMPWASASSRATTSSRRPAASMNSSWAASTSMTSGRRATTSPTTARKLSVPDMSNSPTRRIAPRCPLWRAETPGGAGRAMALPRVRVSSGGRAGGGRAGRPGLCA